jgi:hypothetical protein
MPSAEEVVELYNERKKRQEPRFAIMRELDAAYAGELDISVPELSKNEKPLVANLLAQGLDQTAMRIASTLPAPDFPPTRPGFDTHEDRARQKHDVVTSWWSMNDLHLKLKERARWLVGYSTAPVKVGYDPTRPYPLYQPLDPFMTFLPPPSPTREMTPLDAIYVYTQSLRQLERFYPGQIPTLSKGREPKPDDLYTCLEYLGYDETILVVLGKSSEDTHYAYSNPGRPYMELERIPNRAGICPVVAPTRITLNRNKPMGQFDGLVGVYWWQAQLMALGVIASRQDVFPEKWASSHPNQTVQIITEADGLMGVTGEITGGDIKVLHETPGAQTLQMIDRIERAIRLTGSIPAELGGESASNIRTGRRGQQVLSAAIDFAIAEAQQIFEVSLREENIRAIATDKAYFGSQPHSVYYDWKGRKGGVTYTPDDLWDSDRHSVSYSMVGADANELTVAVGQNIGIGLISKERGRELNPTVADPALENARVTTEALEAAFLQGVQTLVAQPGGFPLPDLARMIELVSERQLPLHRAALMVQEEAQRRQAATPEAPPVAPTAPEAQPGVAIPGQGAEAATVAEQPPGLGNLSDLMASLRRTGAA